MAPPPRTPNPDVLHVRVTLDGKPYDEDLAELSAIAQNLPGVNQALSEQPGRFAWWCMLETLALREEERAADALVAFEGSQLATLGGGKDDKVTLLKAQIHQHPDYKRLHAAWRRAQEQAAIVRVGRKTAEERKDALRELSHNIREEMAMRSGAPGGTGVSLAQQADAADARMREAVLHKRPTGTHPLNPRKD